jgi:hypothetical protein
MKYNTELRSVSRERLFCETAPRSFKCLLTEGDAAQSADRGTVQVLVMSLDVVALPTFTVCSQLAIKTIETRAKKIKR